MQKTKSSFGTNLFGATFVVKCESEQFQKKIFGFFHFIEYVAVSIKTSFYAVALADFHILRGQVFKNQCLLGLRCFLDYFSVTVAIGCV